MSAEYRKASKVCVFSVGSAMLGRGHSRVGEGIVRPEHGPEGNWLKCQWAAAGDGVPTPTPENLRNPVCLCDPSTTLAGGREIKQTIYLYRSSQFLGCTILRVTF